MARSAYIDPRVFDRFRDGYTIEPVLYELAGVSEEQARATFARVAHKLPVRCRFVERRPTL